MKGTVSIDEEWLMNYIFITIKPTIERLEHKIESMKSDVRNLMNAYERLEKEVEELKNENIESPFNPQTAMLDPTSIPESIFQSVTPNTVTCVSYLDLNHITQMIASQDLKISEILNKVRLIEQEIVRSN